VTLSIERTGGLLILRAPKAKTGKKKQRSKKIRSSRLRKPEKTGAAMDMNRSSNKEGGDGRRYASYTNRVGSRDREICGDF